MFIRACLPSLFLLRVIADAAIFTDADHGELQSLADTRYRMVQPLPDWIKTYENTTKLLFDYLVNGEGKGVAYDWVAEIADTYGPRQVGSANLEKAIDYTVERLKREGFDNVHTEDVPGLPHWKRNENTVELIEPRHQKLNALVIDGSPSIDVTAEAIVVETFDELEILTKDKIDAVKGKIVIFNQQWNGYGKTVKYRRSAEKVQEYGAVAVLTKSVGPFSLATPHTGAGARGAKIPTACITLEEAEMLERMQKRGQTLMIKLNFTCQELGPVTSRNIIFDLKGTEKANEIVLLSGHFDSWDVGQGALDDLGGCAAAWQAAYALKQLGLRPKRTIRVIFFTAEEQGYHGANYYYSKHENDKHEEYFFVSESDNGAFKPQNWNSVLEFMGTVEQVITLDEIVLLINSFDVPLGIRSTTHIGDPTPWAEKKGVPGVFYVADKGTDWYFYFHHTNADYVSHFSEGDLEYSAAIFATLAHVTGNMKSWTPSQ